MIKPFPGQNLGMKERVANYRISRARRIVENAFGIATSRFRVFKRPICKNVVTATSVVKAVVCLHNFLIKGRTFEGRSRYFPPDFIDFEIQGNVKEGLWRNEKFNSALKYVQSIGNKLDFYGQSTTFVFILSV